MSVERTGFEILMTADASGVVKGSQDAAKSLEGVEGATKNLNTALGEGKEKLGMFGASTHEVHSALRLLNDAMPGVEQMARFLSNRLTVEMGVGALAISFLKGKIDEMNKALDELQSSPGARGEWADKIKEKLEASAVSLAVWEAGIERIMKAQQSLQQLADRSLAVDRENITAQNELAQAQKGLAEARLELALKLGQVSPEQAVKIRLEIDDTAFKQQLEVKQKEIAAELDVRNTQFQNLDLLMPQRGRAVETTKAAADAAATAKTKNDEKLAQDKKNLDASIEAQRKAQEIVDSLEGKGMWGGNYDKSDPQYYALQAAKEKVESEGRIQGNLKKSIGQETEKRPGLDTAAETSKSDYEEAKRKYEEAMKSQHDLETKITNLQQDLAAEKSKTATLEKIHADTGAVKAQEQTQTTYWVEQGNKAIADAQAGKPGAQAEVHSTIARLVNALAASTDRSDADRASLEETKSRLSRVEMQLQNNRHL